MSSRDDYGKWTSWGRCWFCSTSVMFLMPYYLPRTIPLYCAQFYCRCWWWLAVWFVSRFNFPRVIQFCRCWWKAGSCFEYSKVPSPRLRLGDSIRSLTAETHLIDGLLLNALSFEVEDVVNGLGVDRATLLVLRACEELTINRASARKIFHFLPAPLENIAKGTFWFSEKNKFLIT